MVWKVPLFDLDVGQDEMTAVCRALESGWVSMGEATRELEHRFAQAHNAAYGVALSSATAALHLALRALDIGPGDEVICPSLTFVATANAALYVGATPVFADIASPRDLTISPEEVERKVTDRTRAIVVMHYGGFPCDMDAIGDIAARHGCFVVEDAAHAPLTEYRGRRVGTFGQAGCFSFFSNKNMTTAEGGMLLTNAPDIAERVRLMRSHGMTTLSYDRYNGHASSYDVVDLGYNYRMDDLRASMGLAQLQRLPEMNARRSRLWEYYVRRLAGIEGIAIPFGSAIEERGVGNGEWGMEEIPVPFGKLSTGSNPQSPFSRSITYPYIFPIVLTFDQDRDAVRHSLAEAGIQTSVHYPPVHLFRLYRDRFGYGPGDLPVTEWVASNLITLPFYPSMTEDDVNAVAEALEHSV